jgi:photosynthetic reaction center H subunit
MTNATNTPQGTVEKTGSPKTSAAQTPNTAATRLVAMKDLHDFTLKPGIADPRGWDVIGNEGVKVGKVTRLLLETATRELRYLEVTLGGTTHGPRKLVPIAFARLVPERQQAVLSMTSPAILAIAPRIEHDRISPELEAEFVKAFNSKLTLSDGADRYKHAIFDLSAFAGKQSQ